MNKLLPPQLRDLLLGLKDDTFTSLNCHTIGTIESINLTEQRANISVNFKKAIYSINNETPIYHDYPLLQDCPVICLGGGKGSLRFPIMVGDTCLVLFNDRNMDDWIINGSIKEPSDFRKHSLSDAIAIVGLRPFSSPLETYSTTNTELIHNEKSMLSLRDASTKLKYNLTEINLDSKVEIKNAMTDLKTLINGLIDCINGLITALETMQVEPAIPLNSASISALAAQIALFNAQKVLFAGLLK